MMTQLPVNREDWLQRAAVVLEEQLFKPVGLSVPRKTVYGVGPVNGLRGAVSKNKTLGICIPSGMSKTGNIEVVIDISVDDKRQAVETLIHEMLHATDDCKSGHKGHFAKHYKLIGLTGKATATTMTDASWQEIEPCLNRLGDYPHAAVDLSKGRKKQTTRQKKAVCDCCGKSLRESRKAYAEVIDAMGWYRCPKCHEGSMYLED